MCWGGGLDILACFMVVGISSDVPRLRMIAPGSPSIGRITCTSTPCYVSKHACVYVNQVSFLLRKSDDRAALFNDVSIISAGDKLNIVQRFSSYSVVSSPAGPLLVHIHLCHPSYMALCF